MRLTPIATTMILLSLAACRCTDSGSLSVQDRAANEAVTEAWEKAARTGHWDAAAATYTEDALLLPPNAPLVEGRAAIRRFLEGFPPITAFESTLVEIDGGAGLAVVRGRYTMTIAPPGMDPIHDAGKYIEVRRRQADGSWLISRDIFNSDFPLSH